MPEPHVTRNAGPIDPQANRNAPPPQPAANTIWILCSLPHGIELFLEADGVDERTGKTIKIALRETALVLNGANSKGLVSGGYGITEIPLDFWEKWIATHERFRPVLSGAIKAQATRGRAISQGVDEAGMETGFEPLDPKRPGKGLSLPGVQLSLDTATDLPGRPRE